MSIQVVSNEAPALQTTTEPKATEETKSAPVEKTEQNDTSESETEDTEAKDEVQDTEGTSEESEESTEAKDEKPKKKGGFQRRIDKLNARMSAVQQEAEYWKQQALTGASATKTEPAKPQAQATQDGKPNPDSYETYVEYVEALAGWKFEQKESAKAAEAKQKEAQAKQTEVLTAHQKRFNSFAEKTEDFMDALGAVDHIPAPNYVQQSLIESDHGPEIMYELAKNPEELARICALPPLVAAREIGKIEAKIAKAPEAKTEAKTITKAPKPLAPIGGTKGSSTKSPEEMNQREYEAYRKKQLERKNAS